MRLRSDFWVAAYIRTQELQGGFATLRRRGAAEAGAVFVVLDRLGRARRAVRAGAERRGRGRRFVRAHKGEWEEPADITARLARETQRDPDLWIVDVERRDDAHGLDLV